MALLEDTLRRIRPLDREAMAVARHHQNNLAKSLNGLGKLEEIAVHLAGIAAEPFYDVRGKVVIIAAADHGVAKHQVTSYPQEATAQQVASIVAGGSAVSILARLVGARVVTVDAGLVEDLVGLPGLVSRKVRRGTEDFTLGPALTLQEAQQTVESGIAVVQEEIDRGADIVGVGGVGVGVDAAFSAVLAVFTGLRPERTVSRRDDDTEETLAKRHWAVQRALEVNAPDPAVPLEVLAAVGGLDAAFLTGVILGAAARRKAVLLDGAAAEAAALVASGLSARAVDYMFLAGQTEETDQGAFRDHLGIDSLLDLRIREGDGSAAALGVTIVEAAARSQAEMATFSQAGLTGPRE